MNMKNKIILAIIFVVIFLGWGYFFVATKKEKNQQVQNKTENTNPAVVVEENKVEEKTEKPKKAQKNEIEENQEKPDKNTKLDVPFVVQAPFGNWSDPIFQNACEEASIVMAMGWINDKKEITPTEAKQKILDIVEFENKTFGYNTDTDIFDVQKIFQKFYNQQNVFAKENITLVDIKSELQKGALVIVPAYGRALGNPNFTQPGPIVHMLVIIGHDPLAKEFITNDPGTRKGAGYRYNEKILFDAIWQYPSGASLPTSPPKGLLKKGMVVVGK